MCKHANNTVTVCTVRTSTQPVNIICTNNIQIATNKCTISTGTSTGTILIFRPLGVRVHTCNHDVLVGKRACTK